MEYLPTEILDQVASAGPAVYWGLATACPRFARSLTAGRRADFAVKFGHDYRVCRGIGDRCICIWSRDGALHRTDGPALHIVGYTLAWYVNSAKVKDQRESGEITHYVDGAIHADDGPAYISKNEQIWYKHGLIHRDDAPARIFNDGSILVEYWYVNDVKHRKGAPAMIKSDGTQKWYQHGKIHRKDGPAVIIPGDYEAWYCQGERHRIGGPAVVFANGSEEWWNYGLIHREDGPAFISRLGEYSYYSHSGHNRIGGPACVRKNSISWIVAGKYHKEDGPAVIQGLNIIHWWYGLGELPEYVSADWYISGSKLPRPPGEIVLTNSLGQTAILP